MLHRYRENSHLNIEQTLKSHTTGVAYNMIEGNGFDEAIRRSLAHTTYSWTSNVVLCASTLSVAAASRTPVFSPSPRGVTRYTCVLDITFAAFRLFTIYQLRYSFKIRAVLKEPVKMSYDNYTTEETPHQGTRVMKVLN